MKIYKSSQRIRSLGETFEIFHDSEVHMKYEYQPKDTLQCTSASTLVSDYYIYAEAVGKLVIYYISRSSYQH